MVFQGSDVHGPGLKLHDLGSPGIPATANFERGTFGQYHLRTLRWLQAFLLFQVIFDEIIETAGVAALDGRANFLHQIFPDPVFTVQPEPESQQLPQIPVIFIPVRHHPHDAFEQNTYRAVFIFDPNHFICHRLYLHIQIENNNLSPGQSS